MQFTHCLLLIGRGRQQDEGEGHGKAADGVQLAVSERGAQHLSGAFFCKWQNLKRQRGKPVRTETRWGDGSTGLRLFYLTGWRRPGVLPVSEERAVEGLGVGVVVQAGRGQEVDVVWQHGGSSVRLRDIRETTSDE